MEDQFYELHLTLLTKDRTDEFIQFCKDINVKPVILDLAGETQHTISYTIKGSGYDFYASCYDLKNMFQSNGFAIIREKHETTPWNPQIEWYNKINPFSYYETHFSFLTTPEEQERVNHFCKLYGVHMSRNTLRHDVDGMKKYMGTVRDGNDFTVHNDRVQTILTYLKNNNIVPQKTVTEFAFYDTNKSLDNNWMNHK